MAGLAQRPPASLDPDLDIEGLFDDATAPFSKETDIMGLFPEVTEAVPTPEAPLAPRPSKLKIAKTGLKSFFPGFAGGILAARDLQDFTTESNAARVLDAAGVESKDFRTTVRRLTRLQGLLGIGPAGVFGTPAGEAVTGRLGQTLDIVRGKSEEDIRQNLADKLRDKSQEIAAPVAAQVFEEEFEDLLAQGEFNKAADQAIFAVASNLPQLAAVMASAFAGKKGRTAALAVLGTAAAGGKFQAIKDNPELSDLDKVVNASTVGVVEALTESVPQAIYARIASRLGKPVAVELAKKMMTRLGLTFLLGAGAEGGEEVIATMAENAVDRATGLKNDKGELPDILDDVGLSFVTGSILGGIGVGGTSAFVGMANKFLNAEEQTPGPDDPPPLPVIDPGTGQTVTPTEAEAEQARPIALDEDIEFVVDARERGEGTTFTEDDLADAEGDLFFETVRDRVRETGAREEDVNDIALEVFRGTEVTEEEDFEKSNLLAPGTVERQELDPEDRVTDNDVDTAIQRASEAIERGEAPVLEEAEAADVRGFEIFDRVNDRTEGDETLTLGALSELAQLIQQQDAEVSQAQQDSLSREIEVRQEREQAEPVEAAQELPPVVAEEAIAAPGPPTEAVGIQAEPLPAEPPPIPEQVTIDEALEDLRVELEEQEVARGREVEAPEEAVPTPEAAQPREGPEDVGRQPSKRAPVKPRPKKAVPRRRKRVDKAPPPAEEIAPTEVSRRIGGRGRESAPPPIPIQTPKARPTGETDLQGTGGRRVTTENVEGGIVASAKVEGSVVSEIKTDPQARAHGAGLAALRESIALGARTAVARSPEDRDMLISEGFVPRGNQNNNRFELSEQEAHDATAHAPRETQERQAPEEADTEEEARLAGQEPQPPPVALTPPSTPLTAEQLKTVDNVRTTVEALDAEADNNVPSVVVFGQEELPTHIRNAAERLLDKARVQAVYDPQTDRVYFVADQLEQAARGQNIPFEDHVVRKWLHEQGVHVGIRGLMPDRESRNLFLSSIVDEIGVKKILGAIGPIHKNSSRAVQGEEYLAHLAEERAKLKPFTTEDRALWDRFVTAIKNFLQKAMGRQLTDSDIRRIVDNAIRFTISGRRPKPASDKTLFSRVDPAATVRTRDVAFPAIKNPEPPPLPFPPRPDAQAAQEEEDAAKGPQFSAFYPVRTPLEGERSYTALDIDPKRVKELVAVMRKHYGTTIDTREAGYILPNGKMLDLSGRHLLEGRENGVADELEGKRNIAHADLPPEIRTSAKSLRVNAEDLVNGLGIAAVDRLAGRAKLGIPPTIEQKFLIAEIMTQKDGLVFIDGISPKSGHIVHGAEVQNPNEAIVRRIMSEMTQAMQGERSPEQVRWGGAEGPRFSASGPTESEEFKRWFGKSKVKTESGVPRIVFHGSKTQFNEFAVGQEQATSEDIDAGPDPLSLLGSHFAKDVGMANQFATGIYRSSSVSGGDTVYPVYLQIDNPFLATDIEILEGMLLTQSNSLIIDEIGEKFFKDLGHENPQRFYEDYKESFAARRDINARITSGSELVGADGTAIKNSSFNAPEIFSFTQDLAAQYRDGLIEQGFDGAVYEDSDGGGTSYVIFDPTQAKSASGNIGNFDPDNPDIRFSAQDPTSNGPQERYDKGTLRGMVVFGKAMTTKKGRKSLGFGKQGDPVDLHWANTLAQTMVWYSRKIQALREVYNAGRDLSTNKTIHEFRQTNMDDGAGASELKILIEGRKGIAPGRPTVLEGFKAGALVQLRKERLKFKKEFKRFESYVLDQDINAIGGGRVTEAEIVADVQQWKIVTPDGKELSARFGSEREAVEGMHIQEARVAQSKLGFSDPMIRWLLAWRHINTRGYDQLAEGVEHTRLVYAEIYDIDPNKPGADAKLALVMPRMRDGDGNDISIFDALRQMGDRRGHYMPRIRKQGKWGLFADKEGAPPIVMFFDTKTGRAKEAAKLRAQGFDLDLPKTGRIAEFTFSEVNVVALDALMSTALNNMQKANKGEMALEDFGIKSVRVDFKQVSTGRVEEHFVVLGDRYTPYARVFREVFSAGYWDDGQNNLGKAWHFVRPSKTIEQDLIKALTVTQMGEATTAMMFGEALAGQLAEILHSRGSRSKKIGRKEAVGIEVPRGFETDILKSLSLSVKGTAAGTAKRIMGKQMVNSIGGTSVSWRQFKQREGFKEETKPGPKRTLETQGLWEKYQGLIKSTRIDPRLQANAWEDATNHMKNMLRNDEAVDRLFGGLRGWTSLWYLSGFGAGAVNLTAMITTVPAAMGHFGGIGKTRAFSLMSRASLDWIRYASHIKWGKVAQLKDADKVWMYDTIANRGYANPLYNQEAMTALLGNAGKSQEALFNFALAAFSTTEMYNRNVTIAAAYQGLREKHKAAHGKNHAGLWKEGGAREVALLKARDISDAGHGVYGKPNLPAWARGSGVVAQGFRNFFMFKTFTVNYLNFIGETWVSPAEVTEGPQAIDLTADEVEPTHFSMKKPPTLSRRTRRRLGLLFPKDISNFAYLVISPGVIAGTSAIVGSKALFALAGAAWGVVTGDEPPDDPEEALMGWLGDTAGARAETLGRFGLAGQLGISLKGSLRTDLGEFIPTTMDDLLGAPSSLVFGDFPSGVEHLRRGSEVKAAEEFSPRFLSSKIKAIREMSEGPTDSLNRPLFFGEERVRASVYSSLLRAGGLNPVPIAEIREIQWSETKTRSRYGTLKTRVGARYRRWVLEGENPAAAPGVFDAIDQFNARWQRKQPKNVTPITLRDLNTWRKSVFTPSKRERERETEQTFEPVPILRPGQAQIPATRGRGRSRGRSRSRAVAR